MKEDIKMYSPYYNDDFENSEQEAQEWKNIFESEGFSSDEADIAAHLWGQD